MELIKTSYPNFYVTELICDELKLDPEKEMGNVEYKRTISGYDSPRIDKCMTQMQWRINQNPKKMATYFLGVNDDGSIYGLDPTEMMKCLEIFIQISKSQISSVT